jgi:hypothetical protein
MTLRHVVTAAAFAVAMLAVPAPARAQADDPFPCPPELREGSTSGKTFGLAGR